MTFDEAHADHGAATTGRGARTMTAEDWNRRYAGAELIWTANPNRFLAAEAEGLPAGRALDLAAGEGRNAVWLAERGWSVCAVDFSPVAIEKAKRLAAAHDVAERIAFDVADLREYEPEAGRFDLVASIYLQLPQNELAPILARAARAVAAGGTLLVVAHDASNLTHGYGGPQHPDVLYTAEEVVAAIGGALDIEKALRVERPVETADGVRIALDCLVRARRR